VEYEQKISKWLEYANTKGISSAVARPPIDRMISTLGLQAPPMLFWKFPSVAIVMGVQFGVLWGIFMYLTVWMERPVFTTAVASVAVGISFGLCMATLQTWQKRKWKLPPWDTFSNDP
jgi:hypothetical protein